MSRLPAGATLFFPNVQLRLVRSTLPPHQAVFRVPPSLNKVDIQALLKAMYGLEITDVRTMNYEGRNVRTPAGMKDRRAAFKKVVVTMTEDFVFPPPVSTLRDGAIPKPPAFAARNASRFYRHLLPLPAPAAADADAADAATGNQRQLTDGGAKAVEPAAAPAATAKGNNNAGKGKGKGAAAKKQ